MGLIGDEMDHLVFVDVEPVMQDDGDTFVDIDHMLFYPLRVNDTIDLNIMKTKRTLVKYDYSKPIKLLQFKSPRFDILFYSALLSAMMLAVIWLIFIHDGKFKIDFVLWRVLVCIPLIMLSYWLKEMLDELRVYPAKLMKKHIWSMKELMELTGKDEKETQKIMDRVLEACFIVDPKNVKE